MPGAIYGTVNKVVDRILALREQVGDFGELVYAGMDRREARLALEGAHGHRAHAARQRGGPDHRVAGIRGKRHEPQARAPDRLYFSRPDQRQHPLARVLHRPHHGSTLGRQDVKHLREFLGRARVTPSLYAEMLKAKAKAG